MGKNDYSLLISNSNEINKKLSKEQKRFNKLNIDLEKAKKTLLEWKNHQTNINTEFRENFIPLIKKIDQIKVDHIKILDDAYINQKLSKSLREKISLFISYQIAEYIDEDDSYGLKDIY